MGSIEVLLRFHCGFHCGSTEVLLRFYCCSTVVPTVGSTVGSTEVPLWVLLRFY